MKTIIYKNESFIALSFATGMKPEDLQKQIFTNLINERISLCDVDDHGMNLQQIGEASGYDVPMLVNVLFPFNEKIQNNREVLEVMDSIYLIEN